MQFSHGCNSVHENCNVGGCFSFHNVTSRNDDRKMIYDFTNEQLKNSFVFKVDVRKQKKKTQFDKNIIVSDYTRPSLAIFLFRTVVLQCQQNVVLSPLSELMPRK